MAPKYHKIVSPIDEEDVLHVDSPPNKHHSWLKRGLKLFLFELTHIILFFLLLNSVNCHLPWRGSTDVSYDALKDYKSTEAFDLWGYRHENTNETLWDSLFPQGEGLVSISRDNKLNAPQTSQASPLDNGHLIYQVGVFHHLHCLRAIKWALEGINVPPLPGITGPGDAMDHPLHCVDWLRQALTCNVDLSLDATNDFWTFGHESRHQCRNFSAVLSWTEENRYRGSLTDLRKITPAKPAPWLQD